MGVRQKEILGIKRSAARRTLVSLSLSLFLEGGEEFSRFFDDMCFIEHTCRNIELHEIVRGY